MSVQNRIKFFNGEICEYPKHVTSSQKCASSERMMLGVSQSENLSQKNDGNLFRMTTRQRRKSSLSSKAKKLTNGFGQIISDLTTKKNGKYHLWEVYMLESENHFVAWLNILIFKILRPLVDSFKYNVHSCSVSEKIKLFALSQIFDQVFDLNRSFQNDLINLVEVMGTECIDPSKSETTLGDILRRYSPLFQIYLDLIPLQEFMKDIFEKHFNTKPEIVELMQHGQKGISKSLEAKSIVETPLKRLHEYHNLIKKLLEESSDQMEKEKLEEALQNLKDILHLESTEYEKNKHIIQMKSIARDWNNGWTELVIPGRVCIHTGQLLIEGEKYQFALFNDVLIYGSTNFTPSRIRYKYKHIGTLSVNSMKVTMKSDCLQIEANGKQVRVHGGESELVQWNSKLRKAMLLSKPAYHFDSHSAGILNNLCCCCKSKFTKIWCICQSCRFAVCSKCSQSVVERNSKNSNIDSNIKICNGCYVKQKAGAETELKRKEFLERVLVNFDRTGESATKCLERQVFQEIIESEKSYLEGLNALNNIFCCPLLEDYRSGSYSIGSRLFDTFAESDSSSVLALFCTIKYISILSEQFLRELIRLWQAWRGDIISISTVFKNYVNLFEIYGGYASSFDLTTKVLISWERENDAFRSFLKRQKQVHFPSLERVNAQSMHSLLILPIQRIPRYILLLNKLSVASKNIPAVQVKMESLIKQFENTANKIDAKIGERDECLKMYRVLKEWGSVALQSSISETKTRGYVARRVVYQGNLTKVSRKGKNCYEFVLFNDALMYGKREPFKRITHHRTIPLDGCRIEDSSGSPTGFIIRSQQKSFKVLAISSQEKSMWMQKLQQVTSNTKTEEKTIAPIWVSDAEVKTCQLCEGSFTAFFRRHHCRSCGKCVCGNCSGNKIILPNISTMKPVRVCDLCFSVLNHSQHNKKIVTGTKETVLNTTSKNNHQNGGQEMAKSTGLISSTFPRYNVYGTSKFASSHSQNCLE